MLVVSRRCQSTGGSSDSFFNKNCFVYDKEQRQQGAAVTRMLVMNLICLITMLGYGVFLLEGCCCGKSAGSAGNKYLIQNYI
jgi:hypothetical protein